VTRLRLDPHVRFRRFDDEGVVIQQTSSEAIVLNEVATRLLELLDGQRTIDDCIAVLAEEFDVDAATLERDVTRFRDELLAAKIVEPAP
jgi:coenzyme PQQ biosynthesis protein PqqD